MSSLFHSVTPPSTYCVSGAILGVGDTVVDKRQSSSSCPHGANSVSLSGSHVYVYMHTFSSTPTCPRTPTCDHSHRPLSWLVGCSPADREAVWVEGQETRFCPAQPASLCMTVITFLSTSGPQPPSNNDSLTRSYLRQVHGGNRDPERGSSLPRSPRL